MIKKIAGGILSVLVVLSALTVGVLPAAGDGVDAPAGITVTAKSGTLKDPGKHAEPYTALLAQEYNGHFYKYFSLLASYEDAEAFCQRLGGHLATVSDAEENEFIRKQFAVTGANIWLGGDDLQVNGTYQWINGEPFDYSNWNQGEPNNGTGTQHYIQMYKTGFWDDFDASQLSFVCEWEPGTFAIEPDMSQTTVHGGHRYQVFDTLTTWDAALISCQRLGGHLVTIQSNQENEFVRELAQREIWLGATDCFAENQYGWVTGESFSYFHWNSGEPNNSQGLQHYARMYTNGTWDDEGNAYQQAYVCEWDAACFAEDGAYASHAFPDTLTPEIEATCLDNGTWKRVCAQCGEVEMGTLSARGHVFGDYQTVSGSVLIPPIIKTRFCERCRVSETVEDWSYVWVSVVAVVLLIGVVIAVANYAKAFRKK